MDGKRFQVKSKVILITVVIFLLIMQSIGISALPERSLPVYGHEQWIVTFNERLSETQARELLIAYGGEPLVYESALGFHTVRLHADRSLAQRLTALRANPLITDVEPDVLLKKASLPNDPDYKEQWSLPHMKVDKAWKLSRGQSRVVIAVVDSGIDAAHPDLASKLVPGYNSIKRTNDTRDGDGHGTNMSGIAAAVTNNRVGIAGICSLCKIMPVKALNSRGEGYSSDIAMGIRWAADNGADVINLSMGSFEFSKAVQGAVNYAHEKRCVLVAAAGNEAVDTPSYPAAYEHVIGVAATDRENQSAEFSNFGDYVDLAAPGVEILSTMKDRSYESQEGTSPAAAAVSGIAALMLSLNAELTPQEVEDALKMTAVDLGHPDRDEEYGFGLVNAEAALRAVDPAGVNPTTPTNVKAFEVTATGFKLRWDSSRAAGAGLRGYFLHVNNQVIPYLNGNNPVYRVTKLMPGTSYQVKLRAIDNRGRFSDFSNTLVVKTALDRTPPSIPTRIRSVVNSAGTSVTVTWVSSTDNVSVKGYKLYQNGKQVAVENSNSFTFNGLTGGINHQITIRAFDEAGNHSGSSAPLTIKLKDRIPPSAPANPVIRNITANSLTVSWSPAKDNIAVTSYEVYRNGKRVATTRGTSVVIKDLNENAVQSISVRAIDGDGNPSLFSPIVRTQPTVKRIGNQVVVNFQRLVFPTGNQPKDINGQLFVPAKQILETMGYSVVWDGKRRSITATKKSVSLKFEAGSQTVTVNGTSQIVTQAPFLERGALMIPLAFTARSAGFQLTGSPSSTRS